MLCYTGSPLLRLVCCRLGLLISGDWGRDVPLYYLGQSHLLYHPLHLNLHPRKTADEDYRYLITDDSEVEIGRWDWLRFVKLHDYKSGHDAAISPGCRWLFPWSNMITIQSPLLLIAVLICHLQMASEIMTSTRFIAWSVGVNFAYPIKPVASRKSQQDSDISLGDLKHEN